MRRGYKLALVDAISAALALTVLLTLMNRSDDVLLPATGLATLFVMFTVAGAYDHAGVCIAKSTLDEVPLLLTTSSLVALTIAIVSPSFSETGISGRQAGLLCAAMFVALVAGRGVFAAVHRASAEEERCLFVGDLEESERMQEHFDASAMRAVIVGTLPLDPVTLQEAELDFEVNLRRVADEFRVQRIIIAPPDHGLTHVPKLLRSAKAVGIPISLLPQLFESVGHSMEFDEINGMTLIGVRPFGLSRGAAGLKRAFDLTVASILMVLVAPVMLVVAIAIMIESRGPVFFRQVRVGRNGREFKIIKFRSMVVGADALKDDLRSINEAGDGLFKISNDPRITRIGRFLRGSSLDELPQILNVLRGEMSLVGPRPLVTDEDRAISGLDRGRLRLMPGMTGPWQVLRTRADQPEMLAIDYRYVAGWSLWLDVKILLRTALHVVRSGNS